MGIHKHLETPLAFSVDVVPLVKHPIFGKFIQEPDKFASFEIFCVVAFFEVVEFFKNGDWNPYIMFIEIENGIVFINYYRCIEYEDLLLLLVFRHTHKELGSL